MSWISGLLVLSLALVIANAQNNNSEFNPANGKFLLGVRSTSTVQVATTTTKSFISTCYAKIETKSCTGRRRRRSTIDDDKVAIISAADSLDSSNNNEEVKTVVEEDGSERLVIWTTTTMTLTFTSSATKSGSTLSLAYSCTASGMSVVGACA
ncbi:unnamed protein product [Meganyctiphanes norvegica]|uniref:Uncharacterized protein n=1 Tax=Meganyctiphanes norvegica TaxID=48144 RepID=A0AAV2QT25_MEGNR